MRQDVDVLRTLEELARLLRGRFGPSSARSFVLLAASVPRSRAIVDDAVTQRLPILSVSSVSR